VVLVDLTITDLLLTTVVVEEVVPLLLEETSMSLQVVVHPHLFTEEMEVLVHLIRY
tara:strand:- start:217 stop:384 length:168 start_codon:yes stop_codon:yes gene_type:complete